MKYGKTILAAALIAAAMNLSFAGDVQLGIPKAWNVNAGYQDHYLVGIDPSESSKDKKALVIESKDNAEDKFVALTQTIDAAPWQGKRVQFLIEYKVSEGTSNAEIFMHANEGSDTDKGNSSTTSTDLKAKDWKTEKIVMIIGKTLTQLQIGAGIKGQGKLWIRDVKLQEAIQPSKEEQEKKRRLDQLVHMGTMSQSATNLNFSE
ncbi:hypothetical protein QN372_01390 [Undibacterium sp. RTI2.1]|uniref:hypothetical protein n=1 Tax=unclassified Undibacterium TaxID=2630295 RepID=UPI002AB3836C|nr:MULTISPECIES: hypothetical protein [unclassified Undibacterium]MDY7539819.1 hypothetical protein [Undibacterium sp. 5I1]MEB0029392.1 hypothetical protein [Undibacterium sp. RTI2.1]MEB0115989.1 hypothetical protein [Undibacterium sp. RTI2.2]MEB0232108.1 hypothetical protein [Undibacterium sp. 10I3]MEB0256855.1 hypothetical protein [Undibacterium sp. 5I1]